MYKIEKNVPVPDLITRQKYPWKDMVEGDSFLIEHKVSTRSIKQQAKTAGKALGKKFVACEVDEGCRVWCISDEA